MPKEVAPFNSLPAYVAGKVEQVTDSVGFEAVSVVPVNFRAKELGSEVFKAGKGDVVREV